MVKHITKSVGKQLISVENTSYIDKHGMQRKQSVPGKGISSYVTGKDIQKLYDTLAYQRNQIMGEGLSSGTIRGIHAMFYEAMGTAQQTGLIPRNPTEDIDSPKFCYKGKKMLTDEQLEKFTETTQRAVSGVTFSTWN